MKFYKLFAFLVPVSVLLLASCGKEDQVGFDVQPGGTVGLITTDTVTVIAESLPGDSFPSQDLSNNYIGVIDDPVFGKTRYSVFTQFQISSTFRFDTVRTDSVILYLKIKGFYGDTTTAQRIKVYQVTSDLPSSTYSDYSEHGKIDSVNVLADKTFIPTNRGGGIIRISLDTAIMGSKFTSATAADVQTSQAWLNYFKGLYIATVDQNFPTENGSAINLDLENSSMNYFYTDTSSKHYTLNGAGGIHIAQVKHDRTGSAAGRLNGNPLADTLFILGTGGEKIRITFPYLAELKKLNPRGSVTVNKAELRFSQILTGNFKFTEGREISAYIMNQNGSTGANITEALRDTYSYNLNISSHIQEGINGTKPKGLILKLKSDESYPYRIRISGRNNIKLALTLTKL